MSDCKEQHTLSSCINFNTSIHNNKEQCKWVPDKPGDNSSGKCYEKSCYELHPDVCDTNPLCLTISNNNEQECILKPNKLSPDADVSKEKYYKQISDTKTRIKNFILNPTILNSDKDNCNSNTVDSIDSSKSYTKYVGDKCMDTCDAYNTGIIDLSGDDCNRTEDCEWIKTDNNPQGKCYNKNNLPSEVTGKPKSFDYNKYALCTPTYNNNKNTKFRIKYDSNDPSDLLNQCIYQNDPQKSNNNGFLFINSSIDSKLPDDTGVLYDKDKSNDKPHDKPHHKPGHVTDKNKNKTISWVFLSLFTVFIIIIIVVEKKYESVINGFRILIERIRGVRRGAGTGGGKKGQRGGGLFKDTIGDNKLNYLLYFLITIWVVFFSLMTTNFNNKKILMLTIVGLTVGLELGIMAYVFKDKIGITYLTRALQQRIATRREERATRREERAAARITEAQAAADDGVDDQLFLNPLYEEPVPGSPPSDDGSPPPPVSGTPPIADDGSQRPSPPPRVANPSTPPPIADPRRAAATQTVPNYGFSIQIAGNPNLNDDKFMKNLGIQMWKQNSQGTSIPFKMKPWNNSIKDLLKNDNLIGIINKPANKFKLTKRPGQHWTCWFKDGNSLFYIDSQSPAFPPNQYKVLEAFDASDENHISLAVGDMVMIDNAQLPRAGFSFGANITANPSVKGWFPSDSYGDEVGGTVFKYNLQDEGDRTLNLISQYFEAQWIISDDNVVHQPMIILLKEELPNTINYVMNNDIRKVLRYNVAEDGKKAGMRFISSLNRIAQDYPDLSLSSGDVSRERGGTAGVAARAVQEPKTGYEYLRQQILYNNDEFIQYLGGYVDAVEQTESILFMKSLLDNSDGTIEIIKTAKNIFSQLTRDDKDRYNSNGIEQTMGHFTEFLIERIMIEKDMVADDIRSASNELNPVFEDLTPGSTNSLVKDHKTGCLIDAMCVDNIILYETQYNEQCGYHSVINLIGNLLNKNPIPSNCPYNDRPEGSGLGAPYGEVLYYLTNILFDVLYPEVSTGGGRRKKKRKISFKKRKNKRNKTEKK